MVKTQDDGAAQALESLMGEPQRQAAHRREVGAELSRALDGAAAYSATQQRQAARGREAAEAAAIAQYERLK